MSTVLLAGAFGQRNPGDEALLTAFRSALADCSLTVTSTSPQQTERTHEVRAVPSTSPRAVAAATARADTVVFAGGTVFKTLEPVTRRPPHDLLQRALALASGARGLGKSVAMVGVGTGALPDPRAERLTRALIRCADLLVLRDAESAQRLAAIGARTPLRVGADPAWTLLDPPAHGDARERRDVVVVVSHLGLPPGATDAIADALRVVRQSGERVVLQPWQVNGPGDDLDVARTIAERLASDDVSVELPPRDVLAARDRFARARLVVGMRFHSLVAAAAAATPFLALGYEPKHAELARRLDQPSVAVSAGREAMTGALAVAMRTEPPGPAAVKAQVAAAAEQFSLLRLLVSRGRAVDTEDISGLALEPSP